MTLTLRELGLELIHLEVSIDQGDEAECDEPGSCTTYPVGFVGSGGDQAWEAGVER